MHNLHIFRSQTCQLDKVPPLENGTLVTFINNGLYAMIEQLNNFALYVESRMITLNRQIDTCYANLVILEMKLNSISVPEDRMPVQRTTSESTMVNGPVAAEANATATVPNGPTAEQQLDGNANIIVDKASEGSAANAEEETNASEEVPLQEDPEMDKYRRMLRIGIAEGAVRQKMLMDGVDPARLNL